MLRSIRLNLVVDVFSQNHILWKCFTYLLSMRMIVNLLSFETAAFKQGEFEENSCRWGRQNKFAIVQQVRKKAFYHTKETSLATMLRLLIVKKFKLSDFEFDLDNTRGVPRFKKEGTRMLI